MKGINANILAQRHTSYLTVGCASEMRATRLLSLLWLLLLPSLNASFNMAVAQETKQSTNTNVEDQEIPSDSSAMKNVQEYERGITGSLKFQYMAGSLRAKPQIASDSTIQLRLLQSENDATEYEARFLGSSVGEYDLRDLIEKSDGSAATDLPPLLVQIVSRLPKDNRSDLFEAIIFQPQVSGGYRRLLAIVVIAWIVIPTYVIVRRMLRRTPKVAEVVVQPKPSLADQLRPLVEAASARELSVREKGRLELLLLHYWREKLTSEDIDLLQSIATIKAHPVAGQLIRTVERWIHSADGGSHSPEEIQRLLEPYRAASAISISPSLDGSHAK